MKTYIGKDGRVRALVKTEHGYSVVSYPRILMAEKLGRPLEPFEDVHHIDENPLNNNIDNLELVLHGEHQKRHVVMKYNDKEMICDVCGKCFIWTRKQQQRYYGDLKRGKNRIIACSRSCSSKYGREEQLRRDS